MLSQLYKSPIQSHIWVELSPHIYLFTFWAWSNIIAFRYFGHPPHTFINKVHQKWFTRSSPSPWKREEKKDKSEWAYNLTRAKKKGKMEKPKSNTTQKDIHPSHTHAHDQVLKIWHDLSRTRSLILQNRWGRYAIVSLPWATQKPI